MAAAPAAFTDYSSAANQDCILLQHGVFNEGLDGYSYPSFAFFNTSISARSGT